MKLSDDQYYASSNETEEYIIEKAVIPFINGQVVEADTSNRQPRTTLVNMKASVALSIFCTEKKSMMMNSLHPVEA